MKTATFEKMRKQIRRVLDQVRWMWVVPVVFGIFFLSVLAFYLVPRTVQTEAWFRVFPYPIAFVSGHFITERALADNMAAVRQFYESQDFAALNLRVDFTTPEGQKRLSVREKDVLNKMIEDESLAVVAGKYGITVTDDEIKETLKTKIEAYGTGVQVQEELSRLYGWTLKDFARNVVRPALYQEKLQVFFAEQQDTTAAEKTIRSAEAALSASGTSFVEVAKNFSEGATGEAGGELGWFALTDLTPELQKPVEALAVGQTTAIVETELGYHIILLEEKKTEGEVTLYRLSQIFAAKESFGNWLTSEIQDLSVYVWSPKYRWMPEEARAEFRNEGLVQYEADLYKNGANDPLFVE